MAGLIRIISCWVIGVLAVTSSPGRAESLCNPVVDPLASDTTLAGTLSRIAEQYEFKLTLPESLDRPVGFRKSMTLQRLIKHLTRDMNTVLKHKIVAGCATPVLTHLIVLPVGKETGLVVSSQVAEEQPVDYIYIDNMESYVADVLNGNQQADLRRMTPEQREEYRIVLEALTSKTDEEPLQTEQSENVGQTSAETQGN